MAIQLVTVPMVIANKINRYFATVVPDIIQKANTKDPILVYGCEIPKYH